MKKIIISGLIAGVGIFIISMGFSFLLGYLFPAIQAEYQNPNLFRPWSDPLMSLYFAYPFILGLGLAFFWNKTKEVFKGKGFNRAINFAGWYFLIAAIPGMLITYSSFPVSLGLIIIWTVSGFIEALVAGLVFDKFNA